MKPRKYHSPAVHRVCHLTDGFDEMRRCDKEKSLLLFC